VALGIAVIGSIGAAVYRRGTISAIPAELPPELASVAADTLGGALSVAAGLPAAAGAELLAAARAAFHAALQVNAVIGAAVIVATAVLIATFLRHLPASSDGAGEPDTAGIAAPRMEEGGLAWRPPPVQQGCSSAAAEAEPQRQRPLPPP